jgi:Domain of unknown function (DUF1929)
MAGIRRSSWALVCMSVFAASPIGMRIAHAQMPSFCTQAEVADADPAKVGAFSAPFEEPDGPNPTHCEPGLGCKCSLDGDGKTLHCKPAAVSVAVLQSTEAEPVVYFNGLEDTENIAVSIVTNFGQVASNDQTRVLDVATPSWSTPSPADAGANPGGNANEYLLSPSLTNGEGKAKGEGALFCAGLVQLADGKVLAAGGTSFYSEPYVAPLDVGVVELAGLKNTRIFDPATKTWAQTGSMHYARWYPGLVTLPDGRIFVASGVSKLVKPVYSDRPNDSGRNVTQTETYDPATGAWTYEGPMADRSLPLFPRLHLLPNGLVYYDGAGQSFNPFGQSYDQALWNVLAVYDSARKTWTDLGIAGLPLRFTEAGLGGLVAALNPAGDPATEQAALQSLVGKIVSDPAELANLIDPQALQGMLADPDLAMLGAGFRGSTFSIMLPLSPDANGDYTRAEFLTAGGVLGLGTFESPGSYFPVPFSRIETIDIKPDGDLEHSSRLTGSFNVARWYSTGVLLPDGSVIAFNGADRDGVDAPGVECAIQQAERFDPTTERWTPMAASHRPRTYHNTAVLLPDGNVLVGGHAPIPTLYLNDTTIPGGFAPHDGRDPSFEIYHPPYAAAPARPVISSVGPITALLGGELTIDTPDAGNLESAVLIRNAALTHLVDGDQRAVMLPIVRQGGGQASLRLPSSHAVLPAGPYLLFINRAYTPGGPRIPSKALQVMVSQ